MIRAGREVVDRQGVAVLLGRSASWCAKNKPWAAADWPATVNAARYAHGHRWLWDAEQVVAKAAGAPVPPLPAAGDPEDLLDADDVAEVLGLRREDVVLRWRDGYLPCETHFGMNHTRRRQLQEPPPRPTPPSPVGRGEARAAVAAILDKSPGASLSELEEATGLSRPVVTKHRATYFN